MTSQTRFVDYNELIGMSMLMPAASIMILKDRVAHTYKKTFLCSALSCLLVLVYGQKKKDDFITWKAQH